MGLGLKFKNIMMIILGAAIYSFGFVHFNMQNELGEGGFSGITLVLYFAFNWDVALMNLLLNIPMFIHRVEVTWSENVCLYIDRYYFSFCVF